MALLDMYGIVEADVKDAADYNQGIYPPIGTGVYKVHNTALKVSKKEKSPLFTVEMSCLEHSDPDTDLQATYSIVVKFGSDRLKWPNKLGQIKKILAPLLGKYVGDVTKEDIDVNEKNVYIHQDKTFIIEAAPSVGKDGRDYTNQIYHTVTPERLGKLRSVLAENVRSRAVPGTPTVKDPQVDTPTVSSKAPVAMVAESDPFDF